ncbi:MAG: DnaB-like helicase N-terminal domain-containing protein [bacterium]
MADSIDLPAAAACPEFERGLVGSILLDPGRVLGFCATSGITLGHFTVPTHRIVYSHLVDLHAAGTPIDIMSVVDSLRGAGKLDQVGGVAHIEEIIDGTPTAAHAEYYLDRVHLAFCERTVHEWRTEVAAAAPAGDSTIQEQLSELEESLEKLRARIERGSDTELAGESLVHSAMTTPDASDLLLACDTAHYLRRGGSLLIVAPSGTGKSTMGVQQDISWSLGRECCGLKPTRPLRTLTIQAENDPGDMHRATHGILSALALSAEDQHIVDQQTRTIWCTSVSGRDFLRFAERALIRHHPDILRIDPLLAYIGADPTLPEVIADFCRIGLNSLAKRFHCAIICMHHPCKTNRLQLRDINTWTPFDWQYFGSGGADLANWARAEIVLWPEGDGLFRCIAAKRWPGWKTPEGKPTFIRYLAHGSGEEILWREAAQEDAAAASARAAKIAGTKSGTDPKKDATAVAQMLIDHDAAVSLSDAKKLASEIISKRRAEDALNTLVETPHEYGIHVQTSRRKNKTFIGIRENVVKAVLEHENGKTTP